MDKSHFLPVCPRDWEFSQSIEFIGTAVPWNLCAVQRTAEDYGLNRCSRASEEEWKFPSAVRKLWFPHCETSSFPLRGTWSDLTYVCEAVTNSAAVESTWHHDCFKELSNRLRNKEWRRPSTTPCQENKLHPSFRAPNGAGPAQDVVHEPMKAGATTCPHEEVNEDCTDDLNASRFLKVFPLAPIMYFNVVLAKGWGKGDFLPEILSHTSQWLYIHPDFPKTCGFPMQGSWKKSSLLPLS